MRTKGSASALPPQFTGLAASALLPGPKSGSRANGLTRAVLLSQPYGISSAELPNDFGPGLLRRLSAQGLPSLPAYRRPTPFGETRSELSCHDYTAIPMQSQER